MTFRLQKPQSDKNIIYLSILFSYGHDKFYNAEQISSKQRHKIKEKKISDKFVNVQNRIKGGRNRDEFCRNQKGIKIVTF